MNADELLRHDQCDRCGGYMSSRAMSYFTEEFICMDCLQGEHMLVAELRLLDVDIARLASCGYLPDPRKMSTSARPGAAPAASGDSPAPNQEHRSRED